MSSGGPKARVREERSAVYQEVILDAAEHVFAEHGYEAARVQEVARVAGVSLRTVYQLFDGKEGLYRRMHGRRTEALLSMAAERASRISDPLALLLEAVRIFIEFHVAHRTYLRVHLREGIAWTTPENLRVPEQLEPWTRGLAMAAEAFRAGIARGDLAEDDPQLMARVNLALYQVRMADWVEQGMTRSSDELVRAAQEQFVRAFGRPERIPELLVRLSRGELGGGG